MAADKRSFFSHLVFILMISCGNSGTEKVNQNEKTKATFNEIPDWIGVFQDTLPCRDCPGLITWLEIKPDGYYKRISTRIGEPDVFAHTISTTARWKFDPNHQIICLDSTTEKAWIGLTPIGDSILLACDQKGIPLNDGRWKIRKRKGGDGFPSSPKG